MFENLSTENTKKFRKSLVNELANFLRALRNENDDITLSPLWGVLQEIKGELLDEKSDIHKICQRMESINITDKGSVFDKLKTCQHDFLKMMDNPAYSKYLPKRSEFKSEAPSVVASSSTLFQSKPSETIPGELTIKDRLIQQIDSIDKKEVDKSEAVLVLMKIADSKHYHGFFIDINKDILPHVSEEGLSQIADIKERLAEKERRLEFQLAFEIDKLINQAMTSGNNRVQIIIKNGGHYTPIDIDIKNRSCLIVDAAQDFRRTKLFALKKYSKLIDPDRVIDAKSSGFSFQNKVVNSGSLQKTEHGCWIFSLFHSLNLAKMSNIHDEMINKCEMKPNQVVSTVEWLDFPPAIVCLAQSTTFIDYYKHMHPEHSRLIDELTNGNERLYGYTKAIERFKEQLKSVCANHSEHEIHEWIGAKSPTAAPRY